MHPIDFARAWCAAHPDIVFGIFVAWIVSIVASLAVRTLHSSRFTEFEKTHPIAGGVAHTVFGVLGNGDQVRRGVLLILGAFGIVPPAPPLGGSGPSGAPSPASSSGAAYRVAIVIPPLREPSRGRDHLMRALVWPPKLVLGVLSLMLLINGTMLLGCPGPKGAKSPTLDNTIAGTIYGARVVHEIDVACAAAGKAMREAGDAQGAADLTGACVIALKDVADGLEGAADGLDAGRAGAEGQAFCAIARGARGLNMILPILARHHIGLGEKASSFVKFAAPYLPLAVAIGCPS